MTTKLARTPNETLQTLGTSQRATVARIMRAWNESDDTARTAGAQWYRTARIHADTLAESSGLDVDVTAAVISHLSPRTKWARNVAYAYAVVATGTRPNGCKRDNFARAMVALESDTPSDTFGPDAHKTRAFCANILGDTEAVTVDVWAYRLAIGTDENLDNNMKRVGVYAAIAHCYRLAAKRAGVAPAVMQATTWITARNGRSE
jgi:hypothetical protein